jgi:hypothetical protein
MCDKIAPGPFVNSLTLFSKWEHRLCQPQNIKEQLSQETEEWLPVIVPSSH